MISITSKTPGVIHEFESNDNKIKFPQRKAVINYGTSSVETFGLINCIAIGGIFINSAGEIKGTFMTHESPGDSNRQVSNIHSINEQIKSKGYTISKMVLFKIEPEGASRSMYTFTPPNVFNYDELCEVLSNECERLVGVKAKIVEYGYHCGRYMKDKSDPRLSLCGIATIDPTKDYITTYSGDINFGGKRKSFRKKKKNKKTYKSRKLQIKQKLKTL
jgi:hypothetical protein